MAAIYAGLYTEAYEALRRLFNPADSAFHLTERFHGVMFLAEAAARAGRAEDVRPVLAALEAEAVTTPAPTLHLHLSYARAVLAGDDEAEKLFLAALRADLTRWPWLRARLELAYGAWLRRQRRVAESRQPLRSALTTFDLIGAGSWAEQARSELRAAGERVAAQESAAQSVLSAQELQIARLAAGACPTVRLANASTCRRAPSVRTCTGYSPSWTSPPAPNSPPGSGLANRKCGTTGSQRRGATGQRWPASAP